MRLKYKAEKCKRRQLRSAAIAFAIIFPIVIGLFVIRDIWGYTAVLLPAKIVFFAVIGLLAAGSLLLLSAVVTKHKQIVVSELDSLIAANFTSFLPLTIPPAAPPPRLPCV